MEGSEPVKRIVEDLAAEHAALDAVVADLDDPVWHTPTPAAGWDVADQIGHLTFFDERATLAVSDPGEFSAELADAARDIAGYMDGHLDAVRSSTREAAVARWRGARTDLLDALERLHPSSRIPWYGPDMSARSFATARLMETWAHGRDVADALDVRMEPTDRLEHVAFLGVRTFRWSFSVNGLPIPDTTVRVELDAPSGTRWVWNDDDVSDVVRGDAEEFCLVVTQRRHVDDTDLEVVGEVARRWMGIAQAFAGPPGPGRAPGTFR